MGIFDKRYIFTSNRHSKTGMMAFMFGMMSFISFFLAVMFSIRDVDKMAARMGGVGLIAMIFALVGVVLGVMSLRETDVFRIMPRTGFAVSLISLILWAGVIYIGAVGIG